MVSIRSLYASVSIYLGDLATLKHTTPPHWPRSDLICSFCSSLTLNEIDKVISRLYLWIYLNQSKLTICCLSSWAIVLIELTPFREEMLYGKQVKLSTSKLRQNKGKNKNSDFWNDNNEYPLHLEGKPSSIYCFSIDWCDMMRDGRINVCWNRQHFSEDSIMNMPHLQPQN